jgi:NDP-sugar pyrophosphorylase family protein
MEIALVVDANGRLFGTLTDGDLRRALLAGASMESPLAPCVQRQFTSATPATGRAEVLDLMQARTIGQIPVVDAEGRPVGLHLLHELVGSQERSNWAVVMAGGLGTRLLPLTEKVPKPMIRVAGRPILERIVLQLVGAGIRRVFLAINYLGHLIEGHFGDGRTFGCRIEYLREEHPLGTGGALSLLPERPTEPILVMNGDLVTQVDLGSVLDVHCSSAHMATVGVKRHYYTIPFGCVEVTNGRITRFEEKPTFVRLVNAGIYVLNPEVVARVPAGKEFPLIALLDECRAQHEEIGAYEIEDDWADIGLREQLDRARSGA